MGRVLVSKPTGFDTYQTMVAFVFTALIAGRSRQLCAQLPTIFGTPPAERAIPKATAIGRLCRLVNETEQRPVVELQSICTQVCPRHRLQAQRMVAVLAVGLRWGDAR